MNRDELKNLIYDPMYIQNKSLEMLKSAYDGDFDIPSADNPFTFLLENNALVTAAAMSKINDLFRKEYPILAKNRDDLTPHILDSEIKDTIAIPSKANFMFLINKKEMIKNGYKGSNYVEIILPLNSRIKIKDLTFMLLNDIDIKLYNNDRVFAYIKDSDKDYAYNVDKRLDVSIIRDKNNDEWLTFEVTLNQLDLKYVEDTIIESNIYKKEIELDDKYVTLEAKSLDNSGENYINLNITYSDFNYNIEKPSLYVKLLDNSIEVKIPPIYLLRKDIKEVLKLYIYTTKGDIIENINLNKIEDFTIEWEFKDRNDPRVLAIKSIPIYTKATTATSGGRNELSFKELKDMIINFTTGNNYIPITEKELDKRAKNLGFEIYKYKDVLDSRIYIAHKEFFLYKDYPNLRSEADIFMDKLLLTPEVLNKEHKKIIRNKEKEYIIILQDSLYEYTNNRLKIVENVILEKDHLDNINKKRYFFSPYTYILDYRDGTKIRAYDLKESKIYNVKKPIVNDNFNYTFVVLSRKLEKVDDGYKLIIFVESDKALNPLTIKDLKAQFTFINKNKDYTLSYFTDIVKKTDKIFKIEFDLKTDYYIDNEDKLLFINTNDINNPIEFLRNDLVSSAYILIYSVNDSDISNKNYLNNDLRDEEGTAVIYKESFDLSFGKNLKYLYKNYRLEYTNRKYKRYEEDVYLTYTEDVYKTDENGIVLEYIDLDGDGEPDTAKPVILHKKGDKVLDENGNPIILHKKGDLILDDYGNPIIDNDLGLIHLIDILLLEFEFKLSNREDYINYLENLIKNITKVSTDVLEELNNYLLDNTYIYYKPRNNLRDFKLIKNNIVYSIENFRRPYIKLYVLKNDYTSDDLYKIRKIITLKLQEGLKKRLNINLIEEEIKELLDDNVVSIKIKNLDDLNDDDYKKYDTESSNIVLEKTLEIDNNNNYIVTIDSELEIEEI